MAPTIATETGAVVASPAPLSVLPTHASPEDRWVRRKLQRSRRRGHSDPALEAAFADRCRLIQAPVASTTATVTRSSRYERGTSGNVTLPTLRMASIRREASQLLGRGWRVRDGRMAAARAVQGRPLTDCLSANEVVTELGIWLGRIAPSTARAYEKRAKQFLRNKSHLEADPSHLTSAEAMELALHSQERGRNVSTSARRQYRAAATWAIARSLGNAEPTDVAALLVAYLVADAVRTPPVSAGDGDLPKGASIDASNSDGSGTADIVGSCGRSKRHRNRKTSSVNTRLGLPEDDRLTIMDILANSRSSRAERLSAVLRALLATGARPCEVRGMTIRQCEDGALVTIQNAKHDSSGFRALGEARTLLFTDLNADIIDTIARTIQYADSYADDDGWRVEREARQRLLRGTCRELWPRRKAHYALYSARHQAAADWKRALADEKSGDASSDGDGGAHALCVLAAAMGHATDATASTHYARSGRGRSGVRPPLVDPDKLEMVRRVAAERRTTIPSQMEDAPISAFRRPHGKAT